MLSERLAALDAAPFPRGAGDLEGMDDAVVELADLDGALVGIAQTYVSRGKTKFYRIMISRTIAKTILEPRPDPVDDRALEPYRRYWNLVVGLAETLSSSGLIRLDWIEEPSPT